MSSRLKFAADELNDLVGQVRDSIAYEHLKKGYELARKQAVNYFQITQGSEIIAKVNMAVVFDVILDIDFLAISTCTCGGQELCEHMAAVFFTVYSMHGKRSEVFMNECTADYNEQQAAQKAQAARSKKAALKQARDEIIQEQKLKDTQSPIAALQQLLQQATPASVKSPKVVLLETDPVDMWHQNFHAKYEQQVNGQKYDGDLEKLVRLFCAAASSWKPVQQRLFEIHARLFAILKLEERYTTLSRSHMFFLYESHLSEQIYDCMDIIAEIMANIGMPTVTDSIKDILKATAQLLEKEFYYKPFQFIDAYALYGMFWSKLAGTQVLRQGEKERLEAAVADTHASADEQDFHVHAFAFQAWLEGQDLVARERLESLQVGTLHIPFILNQLGALYENKVWARLHPWLSWLLPYVQSQDTQDIDAYIYLWQALNKVKQVELEFMDTMVVLLPHSEYEYGEYLVSKAHYQRWVDLQIATNTYPDDLDEYVLRKIEKANPVCLLPLYHHAIEDCIALKRRDRYETAVHHMKSLQKLYNRLGRADTWSAYLAYMLKKYSRLRTLKEEMASARLLIQP